MLLLLISCTANTSSFWLTHSIDECDSKNKKFNRQLNVESHQWGSTKSTVLER